MKLVTGGLCALLFALTTPGQARTSASSCESLVIISTPERFDYLRSNSAGRNFRSAWHRSYRAAIQPTAGFLSCGSDAHSLVQNPVSVVPPAKLALLNLAVLAACDAIDGVTDGLLTDPRQCRFDPATLLCRGAERNDCLIPRQLESLKIGYAPARRTTGELIFPGLVPGGETGWDMLTAANPEPGSIDVGMFRFLAHEDPSWDWRTFDLDRDTTLIDEKAGFIDAVNADPSAFRAHGGKLLLYHGWNDGGSGGAISPLNTIDYYESVLAKIGPGQQDWLRLFMVLGMAHCGGGPGPNQVNWMAAVERWREAGIAPDRLIASRVTENHVNMTRPICPYPAVPKYDGVGSTNDAANFACKH